MYHGSEGRAFLMIRLAGLRSRSPMFDVIEHLSYSVCKSLFNQTSGHT